MIAFAFSFPVFGLLGCLFIALRPHVMQDKVAQVQHMWKHMLLVEKIGLVFMVVPVPGPFDEFVGFVFLGIGRIQRWFRARKQRAQQINMETCISHKVRNCVDCYELSHI